MTRFYPPHMWTTFCSKSSHGVMVKLNEITPDQPHQFLTTYSARYKHTLGNHTELEKAETTHILHKDISTHLQWLRYLSWSNKYSTNLYLRALILYVLQLQLNWKKFAQSHLLSYLTWLILTTLSRFLQQKFTRWWQLMISDQLVINSRCMYICVNY